MSRRSAAVALALLLSRCGGPSADPPPPPPAPSETPVATAMEVGPDVPFRDIAAAAGLDFVHENGSSGQRFIVETVASGGGFFDYDGDGDQDLYLVNGAPLAEGAGPAAPNRLYRNDGTGRFQDVTAAAAVGDRGFGLGLAVGDVDDDGDRDLYVTNWGDNVLYLNRGDGTFEEATDRAGVAEPLLSTAAVFFDYDLDGDLDLFVVNYLDFDVERFEPCSQRDIEIYCGPNRYDGLPDRLYRNELRETGELRFTDVSAEAGVAGRLGRGLGVVAGDIDDDGDPDLYVANDLNANFLYINRHGETTDTLFTEEAALFGCAFGESGRREAGMGTDLGDFDGDGDLDITVTNLDAETNSLYRNEDRLALLESSYSTGVGAASLPYVGFGIRFFDFDTDGDLDLFVANGHVIDNIAQLRQGSSWEQPDLLLENDGGKYRDLFAELAAAGAEVPRRVGRGLATADIDSDGDLDVLITNSGDRPYLLENLVGHRRPAVGLALTGASPGSNRDAYGARVTASRDGATLLREVRSTASYLAANDPRLLLAAGDAGDLAITIRWPSGRTEELSLAAGAYYHVVEGEGVTGQTPFRAPSARD